METIDLIATILCSGGPRWIDARDHRNLHRALRTFLVDCGPQVGRTGVAFRPDPDVGLRVPGVTKALWELCARGLITATDEPGAARFFVQPEMANYVAQINSSLPDAVRTKLQCVAMNWAASEATDLKKSRQPAM